MANLVKNNEVTTNPAALNYAHPYFVPIDDGDEVTLKYYKSQDVPVAHIALPGRMKHYYAVFNADTQEEAELMNRTYSAWMKKDMRDQKVKSDKEDSYEKMLEDGHNPADNSTNPEEILAYKVVINALNDALCDLTEEKLRACQMVAQGESQRKVAEELGISRRTLRGRKDDALSELGRKMKNYK